MAVVKWSYHAIEQVFDIGAYIEKESPIMADKMTREIFAAVDNLINHPERGRVIPELENNNKREIFIYSYRIMYEVVDSDIEITAVIHGARDFNPS